MMRLRLAVRVFANGADIIGAIVALISPARVTR
jgi:hypothetical protein